METPDLFKIPLNDGATKKTDWQSLAVGIFIGFLLTLGLTWYMNKDDREYAWCSHLSGGKADYCLDLYQESIENQKRFYEKYGDPNEGVENDYNFR